MKKIKNSRAFIQKDPDKPNSIGLSDIPKTNPFSVPEGYFDRLPIEIVNKVTEPAAPGFSLKQRYFAMRLTYKIALAAMMVSLAFCISYVVFMVNGKGESAGDIHQITASELFEFEGYLVELDESLVDAWIDQSGDLVSQELVDLDGLNELSEADVIAYLMQSYTEDELRLDQ